MTDDEIGEEAIGDDAAIVKALILECEPCARYLHVTAIPARLPGTRWYSGRFLSANGNLGHVIVVMDALTGEIVATYAGVSLFGR
jgi:hypothetical protein